MNKVDKAALKVLIEHAAANVAGVGRGIRPTITNETREQVKRAIKLLWRKVYDWDCTDNDLRNRGL